MIGGPIINLDTFARSASRTFLLQQTYFLLENVYYFFFFQRVVGEGGGAAPQPLPLRGPWNCPTEKKIQPCICYWCVYSVVYLNTHGKGLSWTKDKNESIKMNHNLYNCCFLNNYLFSFLLYHRKLTRFELRRECLKRKKSNYKRSWQILSFFLQIINAKDCRCTTTSPNLWTF